MEDPSSRVVPLNIKSIWDLHECFQLKLRPIICQFKRQIFGREISEDDWDDNGSDRNPVDNWSKFPNNSPSLLHAPMVTQASILLHETTTIGIFFHE